MKAVYRLKYRPERFKIGDKVVPISKTIGNTGHIALYESKQRKQFDKRGYMVVACLDYACKIEGKIIPYGLGSHAEDTGFDYYNHQDLILYEGDV